MFQSSLELSPECNAPTSGIARRGSTFQSSLELSPECNKTVLNTPSLLEKFQSSLELSPECNSSAYSHLLCLIAVSILTRAFARVQHGSKDIFKLYTLVSILTRAFARVQHLFTLVRVLLAMFQSSLELSPECNLQ